VELHLRRIAELAIEDVKSLSANAPCRRRPSVATNSPFMKRRSTSNGSVAVDPVALSVRVPVPRTYVSPMCPLKSVIVEGSLLAGSGLPSGGYPGS
jgi:hypothetical protein